MLNVQDLLCKYVTGCPAAWQAITIHQLLTQTSGIPDLSSFADFQSNIANPMTPAQLVDWLKNKPLFFPPSTKFINSSSGYDLLGYIIEQVSGKSYEAFLKGNIFDPLNMADTGYDPEGSNLSTGYTDFPNNKKADLHLWLSFSGGGLYSSVEDLYMWDQALNTEKLVPQKLLDEMFKPQVQGGSGSDLGYGQTSLSYGYGWLIQTYNGHLTISHGSNGSGYSGEYLRFPNDKFTVIILGNRDDPTMGSFNPIEDTIFRNFLNMQ